MAKLFKKGRLWCAAAALLALCSCGQSELYMDTYGYDSYQNLEWGCTPARMMYHLGLSRRQVDRLEPSRMGSSLPEGTFGYEISRVTRMFGIYVETELYAGKDLYGSGLYTGVYGMKITFNEVPEYYTRPAEADADDDSYYRLDIGELIDEYNRRALYNVNFEEGEYQDEHGGWKTASWYCDATLAALPADAPQEKIAEAAAVVGEALGEEAAKALMDAPLSRITLYYDNEEDEDPYLYFDGFPAAILYNAQS